MDQALTIHDSILRSMLGKHYGFEVTTEGGLSHLLDGCWWADHVQRNFHDLDPAPMLSFALPTAIFWSWCIDSIHVMFGPPGMCHPWDEFCSCLGVQVLLNADGPAA